MNLFPLYPEYREVIVNLKTQTAFRGILWRRRWGYLVLRNAKQLQGAGTSIDVAGEIMIESANVDFIQVV